MAINLLAGLAIKQLGECCNEMYICDPVGSQKVEATSHFTYLCSDLLE